MPWVRERTGTGGAGWRRREAPGGTRKAMDALSGEALPERLRVIPDPPRRLYARGAVEALAAPSVAIVGSRRATRAGRQFADALAGDLAAAGPGGRERPGVRHRCRRASRRARRRGTDGRGARQRPRPCLSAAARRAGGRDRGRRRRPGVGVPGRQGPAQAPVPGTQPADQRAQPRRGDRRGDDEERFAHHGPHGGGTGAAR